MNTELEIDIAWGGYYASRSEDDGKIAIFRLIDFNQEAYHIALYNEKFDENPNISQLTSLTPFIGHAPIDSKGLLALDGLKFIGTKALTNSDLEGYKYYLEANDAPEDFITEITASLLRFSNEPRMHLLLKLVNGELEISQR